MKWYLYIVTLLCFQHCASVSYFEKHQIRGNVKSLTTETFETKSSDTILIEKTHYIFTKNGRVKYSQTFDSDNNLIEIAEKKLWYVKRSFPNKEPYYCKTRWKPKDKERISCYTQKQYKQNEAIYYYHKNGSIKKIADNFTTFYTHLYHYDSEGTLSSIIIKDKNGVFMDQIFVNCILKDTYGNCSDLEKRYSTSGATYKIISKITYL